VSDFTTTSLLKGLSRYPLTKGDLPGHPFHGNQWTTVGGITPDVANFLTKNANKFYRAGGKVEVVKFYQRNLANGRSRGDERQRLSKVLDKLYDEQRKEYETSGDSEKYKEIERLISGYSFTKLALMGFGSAIVATDKDGNVVGAMSYTTNDERMKVGILGSSNEPDGVATAIEVKAASLANENSLRVDSEATTDAEPYHRLIGRTISDPQTLGSSWSAEEVKAIAGLPVGPEHI